MKPSKLHGRKLNDRVLRKGQRFRGQTMTVYYIPGHPGYIQDPIEPAVYVGSFASVKLHKNAVQRNRARRRCKEAIRIQLQSVKKMPSVQLLIAPKPSSLTSDYSRIQKDAQAFIQLLSTYDSQKK